jgi:ATP-dependent Lon protease
MGLSLRATSRSRDEALPTAIFPLFVGRVKTMQALDQAFERECEVVLAVQRDPGTDEPGFDDVYEIGVLAQSLELDRLGDGTLKVQVQAKKRVAIRRFVGESGAFEAEVTDVSEGPIADVPDLEQGQSQDFQPDFIRLGCLKTPHAPRQRTIHHDKTPHHDLFSLFVIEDGAAGLWQTAGRWTRIT